MEPVLLGLFVAGSLVGPRAGWVGPATRPVLAPSRARVAACTTPLEPRQLPPLEPRQLTHEITRTNTSEQLLELWVQYQHAFNTLHISAFWNRLGKLVRSSRAEQTWVRSNGALMTPVREQTLQMLPELGTRSLSNTAHGLASARIWSRPPWSTVWEQLAACATNQSAQYQPQNLANLAWAYATVGHKAPPLFEMIEGEARERVSEFAAQGLTNLAWAYASVGYEAPELFDAIAAYATSNMTEFHNTQVPDAPFPPPVPPRPHPPRPHRSRTPRPQTPRPLRFQPRRYHRPHPPP